jgi:hypothetical protein
MMTEISGFEVSSESQFPVSEMRPLLVADAVHAVLSTIVDIKEIQFVKGEGFPGLQGAINGLLAKSAPHCGSGVCRRVVELNGAEGGIGEDATLSMVCPRIRESTEKKAQAAERRCLRQHGRTARWFGVWIRELAQSIGEAERRRSDAERQAADAGEQLWDLLH